MVVVRHPDFEQTAADIAIQNHYDYVICGHIHEPVMKQHNNIHGSVQYLNSGDWIENLTSLEYTDTWRLVYYKDLNLEKNNTDDETIVRQLSPDMQDMQAAFEKHMQHGAAAPIAKEKLSA